MPAKLTEYEYLLFNRFFMEKTGIEIKPEKAYLIETRLEKILKELDYGSYQQLFFAAQTDDCGGALSARMVDAITTNETFWFRDRLPWQYLEQIRMEKYIEELRHRQRDKIRIWSAASSTGQEAYSTAIMIDRFLKVRRITDVTLSQFEIIATDISQAVLDAAQRGRFDPIAAARGLDGALLEQYFSKVGPDYEIKEEIRAAVRFERFNLQNSFVALGTFDVIFLRYVMIYFSERLRTEIANKLRTSLKDDGVLFLGSSELYKCISSSFITHSFRQGMFYTKN